MNHQFILPIFDLTGGLPKPSEWCYTIKEFRELIQEYGDKATNLLLYVATIEDLSLWGHNIGSSDKMFKMVRKHADINNVFGLDWKPSLRIRKVRKVYRELMLDTVAEIQLLYISEKAIQRTSSALMKIIQEADLIIEKAKLEVKDIEKIEQLVSDVTRKTSNLSENIKEIKRLKGEVAKISEESRMMARGENEFGPKEMPEDSEFIKDQQT